MAGAQRSEIFHTNASLRVYCHMMLMMASSSDDWILLAVMLQLLLITLSHNTIAISPTLQPLFTLIHTVYFQ
jgi:hypothetical protein